jgi:hypothetical protein
MFDPDSDPWVLDLGGRAVLMFTIDHRVTLHLHGETTYDGVVVLETPFHVAAPGREAVRVDPERKAELAPVLELFEKAVTRLSVSRKDGALTVDFGEGTVPRLPPMRVGP